MNNLLESNTQWSYHVTAVMQTHFWKQSVINGMSFLHTTHEQQATGFLINTSLLYYSFTQISLHAETHLPFRWQPCWRANVQPVVEIFILISVGYWVISVSDTQHGCLITALRAHAPNITNRHADWLRKTCFLSQTSVALTNGSIPVDTKCIAWMQSKSLFDAM